MPSLERENDYKPTLIQLMSFLDGTQYERDDEFTQDRLLEVKGLHLIQATMQTQR
jgi:hypothetical protein